MKERKGRGNGKERKERKGKRKRKKERKGKERKGKEKKRKERKERRTKSPFSLAGREYKKENGGVLPWKRHLMSSSLKNKKT